MCEKNGKNQFSTAAMKVTSFLHSEISLMMDIFCLTYNQGS